MHQARGTSLEETVAHTWARGQALSELGRHFCQQPRPSIMAATWPPSQASQPDSLSNHVCQLPWLPCLLLSTLFTLM